MKRLGKGFLILLGIFVFAWGVGRVLLEVQFPDRSDRRGAFPDPMDSGLSLRGAFDALPADGGGLGRLHLLERNEEAWAARWRLVAGARERVDVSYFILKRDIFGAAFLGHFIHKARQGVQVRVVLDAMGTRMSRTPVGNDYLDALVNTENVRVRMYRPLRFRLLDTFLTLSPAALIASDHDKVLVVDSHSGITGGRNISAEYFAPHADDSAAFHDVDLLISGTQLAEALETSFSVQYRAWEARDVTKERIDLRDSSRDLLLAYAAMDAWLHGQPVPSGVREEIRVRGLPWVEALEAMPHLRGVLGRTRPGGETAEVRLLDSYARLSEADDPITRSLIRLVKSARREIFIQSPYLVLPPAAVEVLRGAAERGVAITVYTNGPSSSDNALSQAVFLEQWPELLAYVPGMRLFVQADRRNVHGKLAVFDRELCLIGTYNLDPLSMAMHSELIAAVWSPLLSERLLASRHVLISAPEAREYTLRRDPEGQPLRDVRGRLVIASGTGLGDDDIPRAVTQYQRMIRVLLAWPVQWPVFH